MKEVDEKALKSLQSYFKRRKYTKNTIYRWNAIAMQFITFLEQNNKTVDDIGDLLNSEGRVVTKEEFGMNEYLDTKTKFSASYMNYLCHAMKTIYGAWEKNFPIPNKEFPKVSGEPKRIVLSEDQLQTLHETAKKIWLKSVKGSDGGFNSLRDYCMILISIDCGARRYQISQLDIDSYDIETNILTIPPAKGGRETKRVLQGLPKKVLIFYLEKRKLVETKDKALFLKEHSDVRITPELMSDALRRIAKRANVYVKGAGFHSPRRAKTKRLAPDMREDEINDVMGWKKGSKMSHIYITLDQSEVQKKAADSDTFFKKMEKKPI